MSQKLLKAQPDGWWGDEEEVSRIPASTISQLELIDKLTIEYIEKNSYKLVNNFFFGVSPMLSFFKNHPTPGGKNIEETLIYEKGDE